MINAKRWRDAAIFRRSRRRFDSRPIPPDVYESLKRACSEFTPFASVRTVLCAEAPVNLFRGAIGTYGKIKGAPAFLAFIGDRNDPLVNERLGYTGEGIILEATALGLSSCWVAGFFREEVAAQLTGSAPNETVFAVSPVGYSPPGFTLEEKFMTGFGRAHRRKPLSRLASGIPENEWPPSIAPALECARLAPSAINRQPWRFHVEQTGITVSVDSEIGPEFGISKRLDCGIAMLHLEAALAAGGADGHWEFLKPPQVAKFVMG